jgi:hypothetical protein
MNIGEIVIAILSGSAFGTLVSWFMNRKKLTHDTYQKMYYELSKTVNELQIDFEKLRRSYSALEAKLYRLYGLARRCMFYDHCPLHEQLLREQDDVKRSKEASGVNRKRVSKDGRGKTDAVSGSVIVGDVASSNIGHSEQGAMDASTGSSDDDVSDDSDGSDKSDSVGAGTGGDVGERISVEVKGKPFVIRKKSRIRSSVSVSSD